jgi:hypothetical protein
MFMSRLSPFAGHHLQQRGIRSQKIRYDITPTQKQKYMWKNDQSRHVTTTCLKTAVVATQDSRKINFPI